MIRVIALSLSIFITSCKSTEKLTIQSPTNLPDSVLFRTETESFNKQWNIALRDGRIWIKSRTGTPPWELLGTTGRPEGKHLVRFGIPDSIVAISLDGIHITALSSTGHFYRGVNMTEKHSKDRVEWEDKWGGIGAKGSGLSTVFSTNRGWSVSDCHPFGIKNYTDSRGTTHSVGFGTAHLYRLSENGRRVHYNDWWLPEDWSLQFDTPDTGTVEALNISVSGSTIFIVSAKGKLYTRLYDFDISGSNTLLTYSLTESKKGSIRALPAPQWKEEPPVKGEISSTITIFQTGAGNSERTLRVEGVQNEKTGYFEKMIDDTHWTFYATNQPLLCSLIVPTTETDSSITYSYSGVFIVDKKDALPAKLTNYSPFSSTGTLFVGADSFPFYSVFTMIHTSRSYDFWERGESAPIRASSKVTSPFFGVDIHEELVLVGTASKDSISLRQIPSSQWNIAPSNRKGNHFELHLTHSTN